MTTSHLAVVAAVLVVAVAVAFALHHASSVDQPGYRSRHANFVRDWQPEPTPQGALNPARHVRADGARPDLRIEQTQKIRVPLFFNVGAR